MNEFVVGSLFYSWTLLALLHLFKIYIYVRTSDMYGAYGTMCKYSKQRMSKSHWAVNGVGKTVWIVLYCLMALRQNFQYAYKYGEVSAGRDRRAGRTDGFMKRAKRMSERHTNAWNCETMKCKITELWTQTSSVVLANSARTVVCATLSVSRASTPKPNSFSI